MNVRNRLLTAAMAVVAALTVAACGGSSDSSAPSASTTTSPIQLSGAALDTAFVEGMVPHHQAAVDMANVELEKGSNAQVKALAQTIVESQEREIGEMQAIADRIGSDPMTEMSGPMGTIMGMPISMDMSTMGSMTASAPNTDQAFLQMMIPHHASAIGMANEELKNGGDQELKALSQSIIDAQAREIGEMQQLLAEGG